MTIEQNIAASKVAREVMSLAMDEIASHDDGEALHFWQQILAAVLRIVPEQYHPWHDLPTGVVPMTREEIAQFERSLSPFGKYIFEPIGEIPLDYLEWLDSRPDFRQQLRRYLAAKSVQRHMVVDDEVEGGTSNE